MVEYEFINETLFFPKQGILVIGDLHIGYDYMLRQSGILIPERQIQDIIKRIGKVFDIIEKKNYKIRKIIFLGDIKHAFSYEFEERDDFRKVMSFLDEKVSRENIILIKGNHDTMDYTIDKKMKPYHIEPEGIAFLHGHMPFPQVFDKTIKVIISGHLHPSVVLSEKPGVKQESYKCFLVGKIKGKKIIVMPSFVDYYEGSPVNYYREEYPEFFSIIPQKNILKFKVHAIGKDEVYDFGEVGEL